MSRIPAPPRISFSSRSRVQHRVSRQLGWATEYNNNDNAPGYWVEWDDRTGTNWFSVDQLEILS